MNNLVVMKFGGTSVANAEKIKSVAQRVVARKRNGNNIIVVVSAPGDMTDELIEMARDINTDPNGRDMDMLLATGEQVSIALLSMAISALKKESIALTGPQAGIFADFPHTKARITKIVPTKVLREIKQGKIAIVAGFQGLNPNNDITTLGRGGSDLTAVALAAVTGAKSCEIYTDVDGVYTADPRICPNAKKIDRISYDEMLELAGSGAQVMQARAVEVAKKFGTDILILHSFSNGTGTLITQEAKPMEDVVVRGVAHDKNQAKVSILDVPDKPGMAAKIFGALAKEGINVDMIIQSAAKGRANDISFTVTNTDLKRALKILNGVKNYVGAKDVISDAGIAKVSIVGVGMRSHPGVAAKMFSTLAEGGINIEMISTSEIKIACVIREEHCQKAVRIIHDAFALGKG